MEEEEERERGERERENKEGKKERRGRDVAAVKEDRFFLPRGAQRLSSSERLTSGTSK